MTFKPEYVQLIDSMGSDLRVVNSARVSFKKESIEFSSRDEKLINYLARHNHWTPFSHTAVTLQIKMPVFIRAQWFKHTVGFTRNEVSRRYVAPKENKETGEIEGLPEFWMPAEWRLAAKDKKQGSSAEILEGSKELSEIIAEEYRDLIDSYKELINAGVAPEQARMILPQSMFTEFYETASLPAYARLYKLRTSPDAQKEIRQYAERVGEVLAPLFPVSWKALTEIEND